MRIAFGTDASTSVTAHICERLMTNGHTVIVVADPLQWTDAGVAVGTCVARNEADLGIVCCWTGTGVSIAANKVPGVRAALCTDSYTSTGARRWNDANVLALGLRLTSEALSDEIVDAFLAGVSETDVVAVAEFS